MTTVVGFKLVNDYSQFTSGFDAIHGEYSQLSQENKKAAADGKKAFKEIGNEAKKATTDIKKVPPIIPPPGENGKKSVNMIQQLKREIRELSSIALDSTKSFKEQSAAIQAAADKKAELRDLQDAVSALDPDTKATAFTNLASTAVGAGQGIAGAMALAGVNSEKYEKVLIRLNAISAIGEGIKALGNLGDEWNKAKIAIDSYLIKLEAKVAVQSTGVAVENASTVATEAGTVATQTQTKATGVATIAQRAWNLAMASNPIGLLIVAVAALAAIIAVVASNMMAASEAEKTRATAADGTIILNKELLDSYNALLLQQKKYVVELKVARGEMTKYNGEVEKLRIEMDEKLRLAQQEYTASLQEESHWYNQLIPQYQVYLDLTSKAEAAKAKQVADLQAAIEFQAGLDALKNAAALKELEAQQELQVEILKTQKQQLEIIGQARLDAIDGWQRKEGELVETFERRKSRARAQAELETLAAVTEAQRRIIDTEAAQAKAKIGEAEDTATQIAVIEERRMQQLLALDAEEAHQRTQIAQRSANERLKIATDLFNSMAALQANFNKQSEANDKKSAETKAKDLLQSNLDAVIDLRTRAAQNSADLNAEQKANTEAMLNELVSTAYRNYYDELTRLRIEQNKKEKELDEQMFADRLQRLDNAQQITLNDVELAMRQQGETEEAFERRKNLAKLRIQMEFAEAKLALLQENANAENMVEISNLQVLIKNLRDEIAKEAEKNKGIPSLREFIKSLLGLDDKQIEGIIAELDAIGQISNILIESKTAQLDIEKQINEEQIALREKNISELERQLQTELKLNAQGFASNVDLVRDKLRLEEEARQKALEEQERIAAQQKKLDQERLILDTVQQASALVSAEASLFKALAPLGPPGIAIAVATGAAMLAAFVAAKRKAFEAASQGFAEGGYTGDGGKYEVAGDVHKGEFVSTATDTKKHRTLLEGIHQNNTGMIMKGIANLLLGTGVKLDRSVPEKLREKKSQLRAEELAVIANVDNSKLEERVQGMETAIYDFIKYQKDKPEIIPLGNGSYIERRGNISRTIKG